MSTVLKYLPLILQTIISVNEIIGRGKGATKKKIVMDAITTGASVLDEIDNKQVQAISQIIDGSVRILNEAGVFESASPVAQRQVAAAGE